MSSAATLTLQTFSDEIEKVTAEAGTSVVSVGGDGRAGTGVVWDDRHIVTAYHVVSGQDEVEISFQGRRLPGRVKGSNMASDVALIELNEKMTPIPRGNSDALKVGQFVLALANPYDGGVGATSGIITGVRKRVGGWWRFSVDEAIVTDARVNPGYSGGPLVNAAGQMIGMNVAYVSSRGIAVPVNRISRIVDRIMAGKATARPHLGITMNYVSLPQEMQGAGHGLIILSVEKESPAEKAGLLLGDVIVTVAGKKAAEELRFRELLDEDDIGSNVQLGVLRGGNYLELTAVPEASAEEE